MNPFKVTMGQVFRGRMEEELRQLGGTILTAEYSNGSTTWSVLVDFPPKTKQHDIAQLLWTRFPGTDVNVVRLT